MHPIKTTSGAPGTAHKSLTKWQPQLPPDWPGPAMPCSPLLHPFMLGMGWVGLATAAAVGALQIQGRCRRREGSSRLHLRSQEGRAVCLCGSSQLRPSNLIQCWSWTLFKVVPLKLVSIVIQKKISSERSCSHVFHGMFFMACLEMYLRRGALCNCTRFSHALLSPTSSVKTKVDFRPPAQPDLRPAQNAWPLVGAGPLVSPYRRPNLW